ncbi:hypothetical protein ACIPIU_09145 [Streptomyces massasporeus]|uniref:hypothetical protein n=1 Tax=Streptomyces massasporeus TaxID=67324 RepID=UPI0036E82143
MAGGSPTALGKALDLPRRQTARGGSRAHREAPALPGDDLTVLGEAPDPPRRPVAHGGSLTTTAHARPRP